MNRLAYFEESLQELENVGLRRSLRTLESVADSPVVVRWQEKEYRLFCSNDYLGLSHDHRVVAAMKDAADEYGVGSGA
ncbi:MAG: 8-amino-7-oxononanoate synthase, partial [Bacteroides sp.]|nr:8-amino-7-oxononanoate synthase [Bacteroides sp.]